MVEYMPVSISGTVVRLGIPPRRIPASALVSRRDYAQAGRGHRGSCHGYASDTQQRHLYHENVETDYLPIVQSLSWRG